LRAPAAGKGAATAILAPDDGSRRHREDAGLDRRDVQPRRRHLPS